ncbi:MAG TPA: hypothetical protein VKA84_12000 [Gemmatimonadaceae bacterium]|nr:hypothetical protein [Gemmatimonadaceae bacterium]
MIRRRAIASGLAALLAAPAIAPAAGQAPPPAAPPAARADSFPHRAHQGVFPSCTGCHAGVLDGGAGALYPPAQLCNECHTAATTPKLRPVSWSGARTEPANLAFSHPLHARTAGFGTATTECGRCHQRAGDSAFMAVGRARPETCLGCHPHRASAHLAEDSPCGSCHVPVARARAVSATRVAAFPRPPSHERPDFIVRHAPGDSSGVSGGGVSLAGCAVCHARESCARCHVNAATLRQVAQLERDPRVAAAVAGKAPAYPVPASHRAPDFHVDHGRLARAGVATCGSCHARASCASCHIGRGAQDVIRRLPAPEPGSAAGVRLERRASRGGEWGATPAAAAAVAPAHRTSIAYVVSRADTTARLVRVHPPDFERAHGAAAATRELDCAGCHEQRFCSGCHTGEGRRRYHRPNFVVRHAPESYGRERDCQSCHNAEAFCRGCHVRTALAAQGRLDVAFHNAQPQWFIEHGRAARQGLESCASCHKQLDCMQCHSERTRRVSPHGPNFDAQRMGGRSLGTCLTCHIQDPRKR